MNVLGDFPEKSAEVVKILGHCGSRADPAGRAYDEIL